MTEPWLRGISLDVDPAIAQILFSLQHVREDLKSIVVEDLWYQLPGVPTLGFQLNHIAGSLDRLTTYLQGSSLTEAQLAFLRGEATPGPTPAQLLARVEEALQRTENILRSIGAATFSEARYVGRDKLPTTVIGLAIHIAEHTQRHCGQAVTLASFLNATSDL